MEEKSLYDKVREALPLAGSFIDDVWKCSVFIGIRDISKCPLGFPGCMCMDKIMEEECLE